MSTDRLVKVFISATKLVRKPASAQADAWANRNWEPAVNRQPWLPPGTRRASSCNAGAAISHSARARVMPGPTGTSVTGHANYKKQAVMNPAVGLRGGRDRKSYERRQGASDNAMQSSAHEGAKARQLNATP
eukprot:7929797-Pyramimonas_sp.AAC.1